MTLKLPKLTVILRGYSFDELDIILDALKNEDCAVEVTLNSPDVYESLTKLITKYGAYIPIGAGTVLTYDEAKKVIDCGVKFLLSPTMLEENILKLCQENNVISVPAAMTPSEVYRMMTSGADIIKVFPADVVGENFFKGIRGPLGDLPMMAVGGVSIENVRSFLRAGAQYVGVGSNLFKGEDIREEGKSAIAKNVRDFIREMGAK